MEQKDITESSKHVVPMVAHLLSSLRRSLDSRKFLEVMPPTLVASHRTRLIEAFEVNLGEDRGTAMLSAGPEGYLEALIPPYDSLYTIAPAFRGDRGPARLMEFHCLQAVGKGGLEDAMGLLQVIISDAAKALSDAGLSVAEYAKACDPVHVTYRNAVEIVGAKAGEPFTHPQYLKLTAAYDNRPVFLVGMPLSVEPNAALGSRELEEGLAFVELVGPCAGEMAHAREYETSVDAFRRNVDVSSYDPALFAACQLQLSRLPSPSFSVAIGFERLTQYLGGFDSIDKGVAFPVLSDGRSLWVILGCGRD